MSKQEGIERRWTVDLEQGSAPWGSNGYVVRDRDSDPRAAFFVRGDADRYARERNREAVRNGETAPDETNAAEYVETSAEDTMSARLEIISGHHGEPLPYTVFDGDVVIARFRYRSDAEDFVTLVARLT